jgi:hypothetical protein
MNRALGIFIALIGLYLPFYIAVKAPKYLSSI